MKNSIIKKKWLRQPGVLAALTAALLFGAGTPFAKLLLSAVNPWLLAGLFYLGSGIGLTLYRCLTKAPAVKLSLHEALWFAGAVLAGGHYCSGPIDVWPNQDACFGGIPAVECRGRIYGRARVVRLQGEF